MEIHKLTYQNILYKGKLQEFHFEFMWMGNAFYNSDLGHILAASTLDKLVLEQQENRIGIVRTVEPSVSTLSGYVYTVRSGK